MPIKIPDHLPARQTLEAERVPVMREADAIRQDIRPLRIGLLNLMPDKIGTETQIARLLGATPLQIDMTLVRISNHVARHTSAEHLSAFYRPWSLVCGERFDGFIITGAPVEHLPFDAVRYWPELRQILNWTQTNVHATLTICWAAQAALYHFHGVPKHRLDTKLFGVFAQTNCAANSPYLRGFPDRFVTPVSRWTAIRKEDFPEDSALATLASSEETGPCVVHDAKHRMLHMFNHLEYEANTLAKEYERDGLGALPASYFPEDDPTRAPENRWRGHAHLFFANWINEIYQTTPFNIDTIGV